MRITLVLTMLAISAVADAQEGRAFGADVTLATDYVSRGVSQTLSRPALQAALGFAHESGWSGYVWGSNVDYVAGADPDDGARVELDVVLEYEHALGERLAAAFGRIQYFNPGVNPGYDYDYAEWTGRLTLDGRHRVSASYTDDVFGSGARALYLAGATGTDLPVGLRLEVEVGRFDLRRSSVLHLRSRYRAQCALLQRQTCGPG